MKIASLLSALLVATVGFANYVGNPQAPDIPRIVSYTKNKNPDDVDYWLNAKLDYEKEYMGDMALDFTSGGTHQRDQFSKFYGNYLTLTANIVRRIDLYAKGGLVNPRFEFAVTDALGVTQHLMTNPHSLPAWALGAKVLVFKKCNTSFALEASYFQTDHRDVLVYSAVAPVIPEENELRWYNWQVSGGLSYQAGILIPYIGAKYSRTIVSLNPSTPALVVDPFKMDNRRKWGLFLGCTVLACRYFDLNIEGRLIDENAFSGTMGFRF